MLTESIMMNMNDSLIIAGTVSSDPHYRGEACQPLDLDLVDLEVKGYFRIRKVQPKVWCRK